MAITISLNLRRLAPVLLCWSTFAACHAAPEARPSHSEAVEHRLQALESSLAAQSQLTELLRRHEGQEESPATAELLGRLTALVAALEVAPHGPLAVDATANHTSAMPTSDQAVIQALRQALAVAEQRRAITIENLTNLRTSGYRRRVVVVEECLDEASGMVLPVIQRIDALHTCGPLTITERSLDVAIDGDGWLVVSAPEGTTQLSRAGNLHLDGDGHLVTGQGLPLIPVIRLPDDTLEVSIDPLGFVSGRTASCANATTQFGRVLLARVPRGSPLPVGADTFTCPDGCQVLYGWPGDSGFGLLKQGFLEGSNVQRHHELIELQQIAAELTMLRRTLAAHGIYVR